MISEINYGKLYVSHIDEIEVVEQKYENIEGFETLRNIFTAKIQGEHNRNGRAFRSCEYSISSGLQTRTTAFSCTKKKEGYDQKSLNSQPLPWVVRVYFQYEDSEKKAICSG